MLFSSKAYIEKEDANNIKKQSILNSAKSLSDFIVSFRTTYQNIFIQNHIQLDETTLKFLPVKTTNDIANLFSELN
ncbi:MAG: hypothetical protein KAJ49_05535, partial [Arcobacteraceae bacterium]|nr:hypothetical protein [Arcobacteraceae bacterium]